MTSRIGLPIVFLLVFYHTTNKKLHWIHCFHFIPLILFVLNFWDILFSDAQVKQEIMKAMELEGYAYVWQLGTLFSPKQLELLRVVPFYSYVAAIGYMIFLAGNFKKFPLHLQGFFKIAFWFLLANLLPIIISSLGFEQVGSFLVANVVGLFTTFNITVSFFFIPNFLFDLEKETNLESIENVETIYESSDNDKDVLIFKVEEFMAEFKPFLSAEFSLKFLEKNLNISGRYISAAIKEKYQLNFKNYINWLRIEYFKSVYLPMITSSEQVNLEDIANELGFASINTFYIQFHKFLNTTPRAYIDEYLMSTELIENM
ncbi:helix-turn-helix domain-containing protein [Belliella aquatica]